MPVKFSYQLSRWSCGIGADDRWCISIDTFWFSGWVSAWAFTLHRAYKLLMVHIKVLVTNLCNWIQQALFLFVDWDVHCHSYYCAGRNGRQKSVPNRITCWRTSTGKQRAMDKWRSLVVWKYHIAGNFQGRKLLRISRFCGYSQKFSPRNLEVWHLLVAPKVFSVKIFCFLPSHESQVPAIR